MEKEIKELRKSETIAKSEYPVELSKRKRLYLLLSKHTKFDRKTSVTLATLKRKFLGDHSHDQPSQNHLRTSQTEDWAIMVKERDLLEEETIDLASRNLPGDLPRGRPEHILRMIKSYNPPDIPSVPTLNNELIERCSEPFWEAVNSLWFER